MKHKKERNINNKKVTSMKHQKRKKFNSIHKLKVTKKFLLKQKKLRRRN